MSKNTTGPEDAHTPDPGEKPAAPEHFSEALIDAVLTEPVGTDPIGEDEPTATPTPPLTKPPARGTEAPAEPLEAVISAEPAETVPVVLPAAAFSPIAEGIAAPAEPAAPAAPTTPADSEVPAGHPDAEAAAPAPAAEPVPQRHEGSVPDPAPQPDRGLAGQARSTPIMPPVLESDAVSTAAPDEGPHHLPARAFIHPESVADSRAGLPEYPEAAAAPVAAAPAAPARPVPVYVEAPVAPRAAGNRVAGILISIPSTIVFAALLCGVTYLHGQYFGESREPLEFLGALWFWLAVAMYFLGSVLIAAIVNRAGWWAHVLGGLLIGLFAAIGATGGQLIADAQTIYSDEVLTATLVRLFSVTSLAAFILGREIPIWFGLWGAARGRRMNARNAAAREEYEQLLDNGPQLQGR